MMAKPCIQECVYKDTRISTPEIDASLSLQVLVALAGLTALPWEGSNQELQRRQLGSLGEAVMQLLNRDPSRRATARQFHAACIGPPPLH